MRTMGLSRACGMADTQRSGALEPTHKVSIMEEIENGFQRVPFMVKDKLAGRTNPFVLPPPNECS